MQANGRSNGSHHGNGLSINSIISGKRSRKQVTSSNGVTSSQDSVMSTQNTLVTPEKKKTISYEERHDSSTAERKADRRDLDYDYGQEDDEDYRRSSNYSGSKKRRLDKKHQKNI